MRTRTTLSSQANARDPSTHPKCAVRLSSNLLALFQMRSMTWQLIAPQLCLATSTSMANTLLAYLPISAKKGTKVLIAAKLHQPTLLPTPFMWLLLLTFSHLLPFLLSWDSCSTCSERMKMWKKKLKKKYPLVLIEHSFQDIWGENPVSTLYVKWCSNLYDLIRIAKKSISFTLSLFCFFFSFIDTKCKMWFSALHSKSSLNIFLYKEK